MSVTGAEHQVSVPGPEPWNNLLSRQVALLTEYKVSISSPPITRQTFVIGLTLTSIKLNQSEQEVWGHETWAWFGSQAKLNVFWLHAPPPAFADANVNTHTVAMWFILFIIVWGCVSVESAPWTVMLSSLLAVSVCTIETITRSPNTSSKHFKLRTEGSTRCVVLCWLFQCSLRSDDDLGSEFHSSSESLECYFIPYKNAPHLRNTLKMFQTHLYLYV